MPPLRDLTYREVTRRLRKLGFRFYRQGKDHMNFGYGILTGESCPCRTTRARAFEKELCEQSSAK